LKRIAELSLSEWRDRPGRKPLVLRGARQVGKTYLVEHRGAEHFGSVVTVDLELFYWAREACNANAEVDFVISRNQEILPVEVKTGKTGTLRSTFQFLREKRRKRAVRFHTGSPALEQVKLPGEEGTTVQLLSLPLYAVGQLNRLLGASFG
jgi:hypothetical protein